MSAAVEAEGVETALVWLPGRLKGSECRFFAGAIVGVAVSRSLMAVMKVLLMPCFGKAQSVREDVVAANSGELGKAR